MQMAPTSGPWECGWVSCPWCVKMTSSWLSFQTQSWQGNVLILYSMCKCGCKWKTTESFSPPHLPPPLRKSNVSRGSILHKLKNIWCDQVSETISRKPNKRGPAFHLHSIHANGVAGSKEKIPSEFLNVIKVEAYMVLLFKSNTWELVGNIKSFYSV